MITMDGASFNVAVVFPSMKRSFNIPQGSAAGKSLAYSDIDDIFGTEYGYEMHVEPIPGQEADYDSFFYAISSPVGSHEITVPFAQSTITFRAKVTSGADNFHGKLAGVQRWKGLTVVFTPIQPQRTPA